ncbi:exodeoxyribonuclease VII large subunit [Kineococcus sp. NUM-3379]
MSTHNGTGPAQPEPLPEKAADTTAERPWPLRLLATKVEAYVAKMSPVWVEGQVVGLKDSSAGTMAYFTLRDADVEMSMSALVPKNVLRSLRASLPDGLGEGARVVLHARPTFWPKRGSLNLQAREIRPVGVGELLARLEALRRQLDAEGLFATARKQRLPFLPRVVGLVCGRGSAAERDVLENARLRWPGVRFELRGVAVQGVNAVAEVTAALRELDAVEEVDVIVIARGGGSVEELLPFSNETLVRAVAAARTPVVSAIGHEVDTPLLDLVADVRASTPTDAARRVVPDMAEELTRLRQARERARAAVLNRLDAEQAGLAALRSRPALAQPGQRLDQHAAEVGQARERARTALAARLHRGADEVEHLRRQVTALSPAATLARGYAVVQGEDGAVVLDPAAVRAGEALRVRLAGGDLAATAVGPRA